MMRRFRTLSGTLIVTAALFATACGKKAPATPAPAPAPAPPPATTPEPPPPPPPPPAPATPPAPTEDEIFARLTLDELNAKGALSDAFFAFDSVDLSPEARATLQKNSDFLKRWPSTRVVIEGHTDPRGTNEYNLALGERRAVAARTYLVGLGVADDRLTTVSKGEEAPICREETEECFARNRRAHHVFTAK